MFVDLKHPLERGNKVKVTLKFDSAGTVDVEYPVVAIGAPAPGAAAGGGTVGAMAPLSGSTSLCIAPSGFRNFLRLPQTPTRAV
jgi:hypothetical protein